MANNGGQDGGAASILEAAIRESFKTHSRASPLSKVPSVTSVTKVDGAKKGFLGLIRVVLEAGYKRRVPRCTTCKTESNRGPIYTKV